MKSEEQIANFVIQELLDGRTVESDENLLRDGFVDSLGMIRLVAYIEESWGIEVPPDHFTIENFRSIDTITRYLDRALGERGPSS